MPFQETNRVTQREDFVLRALVPGSNKAALCRQFGITRQTGYKWLQRYQERGVGGLRDMEPGPRRGGSPLACSADVAVTVLRLRRDYPNYGPKKLHVVLARDLAVEDVPSARTICRILERFGLTRPRKIRRRRTGPTTAPVLQIERPNDVWSVDFKGWWRTGNGKKVEPLTVQDRFSRFVLTSELLDAPSFDNVKGAFEELFTTYGLPRAIQSDGGPPFAATSGVVGLSRLSAWWVALGIRWHRSRPACPQDNGGHERMHRDMADDLERHPAWDRREQQAHCDRWRHQFNRHRPHQALAMETPASVYRKSRTMYTGATPELVYPSGMVMRRISASGTGRYLGYQRYVSTALKGYAVGFEPLPELRFRIWFADRPIAEGQHPWTGPLQAVTPTQEAP